MHKFLRFSSKVSSVGVNTANQPCPSKSCNRSFHEVAAAANKSTENVASGLPHRSLYTLQTLVQPPSAESKKYLSGNNIAVNIVPCRYYGKQIKKSNSFFGRLVENIKEDREGAKKPWEN